MNRVSRNALFEVLFKQRQMPVGQTVTKAWTLGEESSIKFAGSANVVSHMGSPDEDAMIVPIGVKRNDSFLIAKPLRKTPESEKQRLTIQDDFDIKHQGIFVSPLGVGSSLVFKTQLFPVVSPSSVKL